MTYMEVYCVNIVIVYQRRRNAMDMHSHSEIIIQLSSYNIQDLKKHYHQKLSPKVLTLQ